MSPSFDILTVSKKQPSKTTGAFIIQNLVTKAGKMSDVIAQMKDHLWDTPGQYRKWGFSIYRTYYGKESDEHWQSLLYSLRHQTKLAFGRYEDEETNQDDRRTVQELFHLDVREDASVLDGLDVRGLRAFCKAENFKATKVIMRANGERRVSTRPPEDHAMADFLFNFVLLADEAVLRDLEKGEYIVKAVSLLWDGDSGWGWMRIPTGYLLDLWILLMWKNDRPERCLLFRGSEEDLESHIWAGDRVLHWTGQCSEIRQRQRAAHSLGADQSLLQLPTLLP